MTRPVCFNALAHGRVGRSASGTRRAMQEDLAEALGMKAQQIHDVELRERRVEVTGRSTGQPSNDKRA